MTYYMPVKVYDEAEAVKNHGAEIASFGKKALIITGRASAAKSGALQDVTDVLEKKGRAYCIFNEVEENPSVETIMKAVRKGKDEYVDFVIGIGGGSPLDAAKAAAFLLKLEDPKAADLYDNLLPSDALPVIAVPTTCGTGSEVTGVSVLTVHTKRTKISIPHRIFPKIALIDGKYLKSASHRMIVNTAADALAHMIESYESKKADDYSRAVVLEGLKIWSRSKDILAGEKEASDEDYANLMRASTFAGIAIAQTGTSLPHALSYILTYDLKMPHGMACGIFLPSYLKEASEEDRKTILNAAGFKNIREFEKYIKTLFPDVNVPAETMQRAYDIVSANKVRLKGCRFAVDKEVLKRIAGL